jgi:hypothetical protein
MAPRRYRRARCRRANPVPHGNTGRSSTWFAFNSDKALWLVAGVPENKSHWYLAAERNDTEIDIPDLYNKRRAWFETEIVHEWTGNHQTDAGDYQRFEAEGAHLVFSEW